ncbi:hypothetical protein M9Y10_037927 [Tritrichomonas musculus]|uniref:Uncharacterized protein n=1 Tax=Tritrichomonas musculus TaxID=1915356 RepID=A0ABR2K760_9EUKA
MHFESDNVFVEKSSSRFYFSDQIILNSLKDILQDDIKGNFSVLQSIADKNNDPGLFFLFYNILYFGLFSIEPDIPLSSKYLSKSASMNHSLAQTLQLISQEDEEGTVIFNQFYENYELYQKNIEGDKNEMQLYQRFYIANKLFYDYHKNNYSSSNPRKCYDIIKAYGIERSNLHFIPNTRNDTNCYKAYKIFRHHNHKDAMNLVRSLSNKICNNEIPYSERKPFDDPYILAYYIHKYDCDLSIELIRQSLHNHAAIKDILSQAEEMEKKQNLLYSLKIYKILSHFGIDSAIDHSLRISKILNLKLPVSIKNMKKLNDQIRQEKCIDDLKASINFSSDLLTSLSHLKHAVKLIPQSILIAGPFKGLIMLINFFNSNNNSDKSFSIYNIIKDNIDLSIFCIGTLAFAYLIKLRLDLFFMT